MYDPSPEQNSRSSIHVVLGILLGVLISLGLLFLSLFLGMTISPQRTWLFPLFNGFALLGVGVLAWNHRRESVYAPGIVIVLSLALILNTVCGVIYFR